MENLKWMVEYTAMNFGNAAAQALIECMMVDELVDEEGAEELYNHLA